MKERGRKREERFSLFVLSFLFVFTFVLAQEPPAPPRPPIEEKEAEFLPAKEEKDSTEGIETIRLWRLTQELKLTEEQAAKVFPKLRSLREIKKEADKMRIAKLRELGELLIRNAEPETLKKQIAALKELEKEFENKEEAIRKEIESILSVEQFARFLIFQHRFEKEIRRMLRDIRRRGP